MFDRQASPKRPKSVDLSRPTSIHDVFEAQTRTGGSMYSCHEYPDCEAPIGAGIRADSLRTCTPHENRRLGQAGRAGARASAGEGSPR
jgi:hypothetical protein